MQSVTLSSKYQIVIPSETRKKMNVKPGQQFWVLYERNTIRLIPKVDIMTLFGTLKGMDTNIEREEEDRI
ncbi:AbrB/MazE/SpoVT family DNA-binding domain-containing protein [Bacteroidota bacterium]